MGKNSVPRPPSQPRISRVQGSARSVEARGSQHPQSSQYSLASTQTLLHKSARTLASPLALSSPSLVFFPQYSRAPVPAMPALSPCTRAHAAELHPFLQERLLTQLCLRTSQSTHSAVSAPHLRSPLDCVQS